MIISLKHVGVRRYSQFLSEVYDLLDDDGIFVLQVAGIRPSWQYEDLIWLALSGSTVDMTC
jgi:cyclopropane fatty-acyl-phospholipid synthase-like methyltransferase